MSSGSGQGSDQAEFFDLAGDSVKNVRVGGHAVQIMEGTVSL